MARSATVRETGLGVEALLDVPKKLGTFNSAVLKSLDIALTKGIALIDEQVKTQLQSEISQGKKRPLFNSATGQNRSGSGGKRRKPPKTSHYSLPDHSPNADTGRLAQSFGLPIDADPLNKYIKTDVGYAKYLEPLPNRRNNRPFLQPAVDRSEKNIMIMIRKALQKSTD